METHSSCFEVFVKIGNFCGTRWDRKGEIWTPFLNSVHGNPALEFRKQRATISVFPKWGVCVSQLVDVLLN